MADNGGLGTVSRCVARGDADPDRAGPGPIGDNGSEPHGNAHAFLLTIGDAGQRRWHVGIPNGLDVDAIVAGLSDYQFCRHICADNHTPLSLKQASTIKIAPFIFIQFFFPGSGFAVLQQYGRSSINLGFPFLIAALFCWTRLALTPAGLTYFLGVLLFSHIVLTIWFISAWLKPASTPPPSLIKRLPALLFFLCLSLSLFGIGFLTKHHWLGVHLYFVPSASMQPALLPGDFILVDTWHYRQTKPRESDIVVFKRYPLNEIAVKRIHRWPSGELVINDNYYVLGDNHHHSADSRWFGGIQPNWIQGKVAVIVISIDSHLQIKLNRWLQAVH